MLALGASAKYLSLSYGSDAYTALDPVFGNGYTRSGISADAGILFMPLPRLTFGYSRMNILSADMGLRENAAVPAIERAGVSYAEETALSTLEATRIEGQLRFAAGIEKYFAQKLVCLRLGFGWGDREYRKVTAGLGLAVQQLSIGYAWDYPLSGIRDVSGTHYVTIGFSFGGEQAGARHSVAEQPVRPTLPQEITASPVPVSADAESSREDVVLSTPAPIVPVVSESSAAVPSVTAKKEPRQVERKAAAKTHITHTVAGGETLPALAEKYYGARASWTRIYEANKDKVEKGSLKPGDVLIIP
jgi:LysM repeat protein